MAGLWPLVTALSHTRHQVTLLSYCPALFFCAKAPLLVLTNQAAQSLPDTFLLFINIPIQYQSQFMTGQHAHVIPYKYPIFGQRPSDQELGKKKDSKAYSTYKSWIILWHKQP